MNNSAGFAATIGGGRKMKGKKKAHPGFAAVQDKIAAREDVSKDRAGAMLAASTRRASPAAKKANPALKKVKMPHKGHKGY